MSIDIMIVGAHPDDAEIAMGGTIASFINAGKSVAIVDLSNGEPTPFGTPERRLEESQKAAEVLGVKHRINLGFTNREIQDTVENRKRLAEVFRELKPTVLFGPYLQDAHPDHIAAGHLTEAARFYSKFVKSDMAHEPTHPQKFFHFFCNHYRLNVTPSFTYDISDCIETKINALKCYKSQFEDNPKNQSVYDRVRNANRYWGIQTRTGYAEPFSCPECILFTKPESFLDA